MKIYSKYYEYVEAFKVLSEGKPVLCGPACADLVKRALDEIEVPVIKSLKDFGIIEFQAIRAFPLPKKREFQAQFCLENKWEDREA